LEKELDKLIEESRGEMQIGTTRRGIGPAYAMRTLRLSPTAFHIVSGNFDMNSIVKIYKMLGIELNYMKWIEGASSILKPILEDVHAILRDAKSKGEEILFEGSQGTLLDLIYGTYPYVTGCQTISGFIFSSLGLWNLPCNVLGVTKCYTTRVGSGPFPTEIKGQDSELLRNAGNEYGSTTGRPRRVGWLDLVLLKYACKINGVDSIALTKLDVLSKIKHPYVCISYNVNGKEVKEYDFSFPLENARPNLLRIKSFYGEKVKDMPGGVKEIIKMIEDETGLNVKLLSFGQERGEIIEL
jgi:adenylosuccinate synthase